MKRLCTLTLIVILIAAVACAQKRAETEPTSSTAATALPSTVDTTMPPAGVTATNAAQTTPAGDEDAFTAAREAMVDEGIVGMGITDETVIAAMSAVPRHRFVPEEWLAQAYENHPLPIGHGQTISQPYIVALMTEAAEVGDSDRVLEIGTGSGYQAAVLAEIVDHIYTVEIIGALAERAEATLETLGYDNVTVRHADGYYGWEEEAPFDAILVTAAPDHIPQPLVAQLKVGGQMIIPVGPVGGYQTLWRVTRVSEEEVRTEDLGGVVFVPFTREEPES